MSTLHERLGDLAGSAPVPPPDPDLWDRARRYHRRRRVGTAAVAAACVLAVVALVGSYVATFSSFLTRDCTALALVALARNRWMNRSC